MMLGVILLAAAPDSQQVNGVAVSVNNNNRGKGEQTDGWLLQRSIHHQRGPTELPSPPLFSQSEERVVGWCI